MDTEEAIIIHCPGLDAPSAGHLLDTDAEELTRLESFRSTYEPE